jgi:streptogramin lyase
VNGWRAVALALALSAGISRAGSAGGEAVGAPPATPHALQLVRVVPLAITEPSDFCLDRDGVHWWTVSNSTGRVYRLRLSDCAIVRTLAYRGDDPEGVWQDPENGTLYVTEEKTRQIVHMDSTGKVLGKVTVPGLGGKANSGLEGITFHPARRHFFVVQEKQPARLVEVDPTGKVVALHPVTDLLDLSGVTYVPSLDQLLVVSDQSQRICRVSLTGEPVSYWDLPVANPEGVGIDTTLGRVYVVSDIEGKFYEFQAP